MKLLVGPLMESVLASLSQYNELDCEESKLNIRLLHKQ